MTNNNIKKKETRKIWVGDVPIGGDSPISIQSMTNTRTEDIEATVLQIKSLEEAGADIVRVSTPNKEAVEAFGAIKRRIKVPLVADIHFDYKLAITVAEKGANCLRINPGNIGSYIRVKEVIASAKHHDIPIRIGVNAGSLEKSLQEKYGEPNADALVESAMHHIDILDKNNFSNFKISVKASNVLMMVEAYRKLSKLIDQPLHLGVTEAGSMRSGTVKSSIGIGSLLMEGIGDTIRVSLAADPVEEVKVGWDMLKSLQIRSRGINFIACPSCSRQNFDVIKTMNILEEKLSDITTPMTVAVIGCIVNGPGEAKEADIGLTGGDPNHLVYIDGNPHKKISTEKLLDELEGIIRNKAEHKKKMLIGKS